MPATCTKVITLTITKNLSFSMLRSTCIPNSKPQVCMSDLSCCLHDQQGPNACHQPLQHQQDPNAFHQPCRTPDSRSGTCVEVQRQRLCLLVCQLAQTWDCSAALVHVHLPHLFAVPYTVHILFSTAAASRSCQQHHILHLFWTPDRLLGPAARDF